MERPSVPPLLVRVAVRLLPAVVFLLVGLGLVELFSASSVRGMDLKGDPLFFMKRQGCWVAVGFVTAWVTSRLPLRLWERLAWLMAAAALLLLALVLLIGHTAGGSRRWLFGFQPSEVAKFAAVVALAAWIARIPLRRGRFREGLLLPGLGLVVTMLLILAEPDFGTTLLVGAVGWTILYVSGAQQKWLFVGAAIALLGLFVFLRTDAHRWGRVKAWWDPDHHKELAHQYIEARTAFALGGTGIKLGDSFQKERYLPEAHTDYIFAILGEELGIWGTLTIVALFAAFLACGFCICLGAPDTFGAILAFGMTLCIGLQAVINMYVTCGLLPTKGWGLPLVSFGGSNMVMTLAQVGILVNIGRRALEGLEHDRATAARWWNR